MSDKKSRKRRDGLWTLIIVAVLIGAVVFALKSGFIRIERKSSSALQDKVVQVSEKVVETAEKIVVGEEGTVETVTEAHLQDVVTTSTLYVAEYPYNGIATAYTEPDKDGESEVRYYVAYEGRVRAGIDVTQITVTLDEETDTIVIRLPEVTLETPTVDAGTMEFIFTDDSYNTETVAQEAHHLALEDLKDSLADDESIIEAATAMAKTAEAALVEPWVDQVGDTEYTVIVLAYDEEVAE